MFVFIAYNVTAMASGAVDKRLPFRLSRSQSFCILFYLISLKAKSKDLAVFANTQKHLIKPIIAMFYTRYYGAFLFE